MCVLFPGLCKNSIRAHSQYSVSGEPYLGWDESRVAYSGSYRCRLVRGMACRTCHGSGMAEGMIEAVFACCQLLPLLMLQLSILPVSISLSPTPVLTVELLMVAAIKRGSYPIRHWYRGKRWGKWWVPLLAPSQSGPEMLSPALRSQQMNVKCLGTAALNSTKDNEWYCSKVWIIRFLPNPAKQTWLRKKFPATADRHRHLVKLPNLGIKKNKAQFWRMGHVLRMFTMEQTWQGPKWEGEGKRGRCLR